MDHLGDRAGKYFLAPEDAPGDAYAAGWDGNVFDSYSEAEAAIPGLRALGDEWDHAWVVSRYGEGRERPRDDSGRYLPGATLTDNLLLRLSPEQRARWQAAADAAGVTLSEWMRRTLDVGGRYARAER